VTIFGTRDFDGPRAEATIHPIKTGGIEVAAPPTPAAADLLSGEERRVLLRVHSGEEITLGVADDREEGLRLARETIRLIDEAEARGEWPELDERFIRPSAIVSIDVQRAS
jgi:hypothetical protein